MQNPANNADQSQVQGLYLQLVVSDGFDDHDPEGSISLTLVPANAVPVAAPPNDLTDGDSDAVTAAASSATTTTTTTTTPIQDLFAAVSACANLHPDPVSQSSSQVDLDEGEDAPTFEYQAGDPSGDLPPPMPGSGGWITAENMDQFFDENGNWRGEGLGPGAGIVREREDDEEHVNGDGAETDGADETKWRRTG